MKTYEHRAGSMLKQRIFLVIQIAKAAGLLGTINDKTNFDDFFVCYILRYFLVSSCVSLLKKPNSYGVKF